MAATRARFTATYLYPGSFVSETKTRTLDESTLQAALAAMPEGTIYGGPVFGIEIIETLQKRFVSDDGEERWLADSSPRRIGRWYFGETLTLAHVTALNVTKGGAYDVLLANMRGNGWTSVVRTVAGNFQPVEYGDVVLPASEHPKLPVTGR